MRIMAITGTILWVASAAGYTWLSTSLSEVSLLIIWGGALLAIARRAQRIIAITGTILWVASAAGYTWLYTSLSEVSLLIIWGGALLAIARRAQVQRTAEAPVPASSPLSTGAIRFQPGL